MLVRQALHTVWAVRSQVLQQGLEVDVEVLGLLGPWYNDRDFREVLLALPLLRDVR